ncbi:MAG: hypothetical protein QOJ64_2964, partial [Acidobacteriota bacterium]|nr:hypothetical protein [Acidobacteriota bacterium]
VDGLRNGSPLGVEPKGEGITGKSGYSTGTSDNKPAETPKPTEVRPAAPASGSTTGETKAISFLTPKYSEMLPSEPPPPAPQAKIGPPSVPNF